MRFFWLQIRHRKIVAHELEEMSFEEIKSMKHHYDHVVIDVPMDEEGHEQIQYLKNSPILKSAKHVTLHTIYNDSMGVELPAHIVDKNKFPEIEEHILSRLEDIKTALMPADADSRSWSTKCTFNAEPKRIAVEYLQESKADLAISATRGEQGIRGLFKESFAFYLIEYAPCDVYVIRPIH